MMQARQVFHTQKDILILAVRVIINQAIVLLYKSKSMNFTQKVTQQHKDNSENISNFSNNQNKQKNFAQEHIPTKNSIALAQQWKIKGTQFFKKQKYLQAIQCYEQAINLNPAQPKYYSNLGISYCRSKQFKASIQIIAKMQNQFSKVKLDEHFLLKALMIKYKAVLNWARKVCLDTIMTLEECHELKQNLIETIKELQDLHRINMKKHYQSPSEHIDFLEQIEQQLQNGYKLYDYFHSHIQNRERNITAISYLQKRIKSEQALNAFCQGKLNQLFKDPEDILNELIKQEAQNKIFVQQQQEFEEFLIDPINFENFHSPLIVPSGLTYEQSQIKEHFKRNSLFDPITRQYYEDDFRINDVIGVPNRAILRLIDLKGKKVRKGDIFYMQC